MTTTLDASNLSLEEVEAILNYQEQFNYSLTSLLSLEPLTEFEQQELEEIRILSRSYYAAGKISEGPFTIIP